MLMPMSETQYVTDCSVIVFTHCCVEWQDGSDAQLSEWKC